MNAAAIMDNRVNISAMMALNILARSVGAASRDHRLRIVSAIVKRPVSTSKELSWAEYRRVMAVLQAKANQMTFNEAVGPQEEGSK